MHFNISCTIIVNTKKQNLKKRIHIQSLPRTHILSLSLKLKQTINNYRVEVFIRIITVFIKHKNQHGRAYLENSSVLK